MMGYFDKYLMHEDGRNKGMNSTSSEKGTDGKKNNTSEYNHQYYMKNKEKWRDNKSVQGGAGYKEYDENDHDFDEENYNEKNRVGGTDFFIKEKPDGSLVVLEEDMKWTLPPGTNKEDVAKAIEAFDKEIVARREKATTIEEFKAAGANWFKEITEAINKAARGKSGGEKEFDVDAAARDVIRGKYGNGAERRAALGDDYAEVQKRVNEILGGKTSSEPKRTSKNSSKPVDGPKETPHANFPSSNSTSSAPRAREKNVTGTGTGLYRRGKVEDNKPRKREKKVTGNGTGLYTRGKVAHAERGFNVGYFYKDDELAHHGIKGQKWGVRRFENKNGTLTTAGKMRYGENSDLYNAKKGQLSSTFKSIGNTVAANVYGMNKKVYKNSNKTLSSMNAAKESEFRKKAEKHAADAVKKNEAKKAYKEEYKKNLKEIRDNTSLAQKLVYNDATRKRAAKIMTKYKNVSMNEAIKQAQHEANRNTALILTTFGTVAVAKIYGNKKKAESSYSPISSNTLAQISNFRPH